MEKTTCIIVGAGPAGSACALSLARKGIETVLLERGRTPGEKNVSSFVLFIKELKRLVPECMDELELERNIVRSDQIILSDDDVKTITSFNYKHIRNPVTFSAFRRKFDAWFAKKASMAGAELITGMTVTDLIIDNGRVIGVKVGDEELYADVVVGADGYHSKVAERSGLNPVLDPGQCLLSVKEVLNLPAEVINDRFQLTDGLGAELGLWNYDVNNFKSGTGTLYTNTDSISIAAFASVADLKNKNMKLHAYLEKFKQHPYINALIKDGTLREYQAHILSNGGRIAPEKLYGDGVLLCGEAGAIMDTMSGMGVPTCIVSGMMAAETIEMAVKKRDFSAGTLKNYLKYLDSTSLLDMVYESSKVGEYWDGAGKDEMPDDIKAVADCYNKWWDVDYMSKDYYPLMANLFFKIGKHFMPKILRWPLGAAIKITSLYSKTCEKIKSKIRSRYYEWKKQYDG
ncbi:MAG: FAD-dependent monooxygenase [Desulfobacterales bacterium]|nr:FAD-dependent monooxygenase [Desulfobacterales bacterium]